MPCSPQQQASSIVVVVSSETLHPRESPHDISGVLMRHFWGIAHDIFNTLCTAPGRPASGWLVAAVLVGLLVGLLVGC